MTAFRTGWNFGETTEAFAVKLRDQAGSRWRPAATATSPATPRWAWADRREPAVRAAAVPRLVPDHPGLRRAARAVQAQAVRRHAPSRPRTRSRAWAPLSARPSAGRSASPPPPDPGVALKAETIGLGVMLELPLLVCDIQRGGPSAGLPTKTEQADLLQALFGRNGEAPLPVVAPRSPGRLLRRSDGGGADRGHLPHPGDAAVRRLRWPTAPSRGRCPTSRRCRRSGPTSRPGPTARTDDGGRRVPAVPARRGDARPAVGRARHSRADAPGSAVWRRPTAPATSPTTRPTTT